MYSVLNFCQEGSVLRFTFATLGLEEHEWHHSAFAEPLTKWLKYALLPLFREHENTPSAQEIVHCISQLAEKELIPITEVDWLGLALLAAQSYREAAAKLAVSDSADLQEKCSRVAGIATTLCDIHERCAQAVQAKLRELYRDAA